MSFRLSPHRLVLAARRSNFAKRVIPSPMNRRPKERLQRSPRNLRGAIALLASALLLSACGADALTNVSPADRSGLPGETVTTIPRRHDTAPISPRVDSVTPPDAEPVLGLNEQTPQAGVGGSCFTNSNCQSGTRCVAIAPTEARCEAVADLVIDVPTVDGRPRRPEPPVGLLTGEMRGVGR